MTSVSRCSQSTHFKSWVHITLTQCFINILFQADMEPVQLAIFILLCMSAPYHADCSINIALNQPAYQSSIYGSHVAARAVDGNRNTKMNGNSCAVTHKNTVGPWWCVDLGAIYTVTRVTIVNRDRNADRMNGINVGVMNVRPTTPLQISSYDVCATFQGPASPSQIIVLDCEQVCIYSSNVT